MTCEIPFDGASLDALLKTALDAVIVMRTDGLIAGWNDVAEKTFGWSYTEAYGRRMSDLIIPRRYRHAHEQGLSHYIQTGEGPVLGQHIEIAALHRDGHELPIELSITATEQFGTKVFLGFLRDISERHEAARRQELLIDELNHRVKNMLAVVCGIAHLTSRSSDTVEQFVRAFGGRLAALGHAYDILDGAPWQSAPLHSLLLELLGPYLGGEEPQVVCDGPEILLPSRHLISLSMIVHELITNSLKYGALSQPQGQISVSWGLRDSQVTLQWGEAGLVDVKRPFKRGFGSKMIARTVVQDLGGREETEWRSTGLNFTVEFPFPTEASPSNQGRYPKIIT